VATLGPLHNKMLRASVPSSGNTVEITEIEDMALYEV
jgi:hypothetical protein